MQVMVVRFAINKGNVPSRYTSDGSREAIVDPHFQATDVEIVEIAIQWSISVHGLEMSVVFFPKTFAKKVSNVAENDEDQIADVGCEEVVVRRLVHDWLWITTLESTRISVTLAPQRPELGILSGYPSGLGWRRWLEERGRRFIRVGSAAGCSRKRDSG